MIFKSILFDIFIFIIIIAFILLPILIVYLNSTDETIMVHSGKVMDIYYYQAGHYEYGVSKIKIIWEDAVTIASNCTLSPVTIQKNKTYKLYKYHNTFKCPTPNYYFMEVND